MATGATTAKSKPRLVRLLRRVTAAGAWLALLCVLAAWGLLQFGDDWWPATLLMFSPRWLLALPPLPLVIASAAVRPRSLLPSLLALGLALGPVMGLCLPWRPLLNEPPADLHLRVLTCNMHYGKTDPALLDNLISETKPDVVALQEWRDSAQSTVLKGDDWFIERVSGLCLASRFPIVSTERIGAHSTGPRGLVMRYQVLAPRGTVTVFNLHLASPRDSLGQVVHEGWAGRDSLRANTAQRREQLEFLAAQAGRATGPVLLVGDFNTPPESELFQEYFANYRDAFGEAGLGWGYTFVSRRTAVRIDHILIGGSGRASRCWIGSNVGSPHRPVIADVAWPAEAH